MNLPQVRSVAGISGLPDYQVAGLNAAVHDVALVIPVLNEDGRITRQLESIQRLGPAVDVIVTDGGSTDGSTEKSTLKNLGVTTLLTKTGPGKLSAQLRVAIHHCLESGYESIITMDGNGKDGVDGIGTIAAALREGFDFVQGSRFVSGGVAENTPRDRYLAIRLVHAPILSLGARHWYTDTTNGFRGHSRRLLGDNRVAPLRDVFDTYELLAYLPVQAARLGFRVTEVPVTRTYPTNGAKPTKIHGASAHADLLRILFKAARGGYRPLWSPATEV